MGQINRIKVVMVCHLSNPAVRAHLPLSKRRLYAFIRKLMGLPYKGRGYGDFAPWDTDLINYFNSRDDIELHVISAHSGLKKRICRFVLDGVHYYFVRCEFSNMLKHIIPSDSLWIKMNPMSPVVRHIVKEIKPDIINLQGTENAYYSGTVLGIQGYPIYVLCQTIYNNPDRSQYMEVLSKNATTEMAIFQKERYFGVYCKMHYELLRGFNPSALIFKFNYPKIGKLLEPIEQKKEFDFVNFALTMDLRKGFHDSIQAIALIKEKHPTVKLNLVGGSTVEGLDELKSLASKLNVKDNVVFTPFFAKQSDLFLHIQKSRFALLPCKLDNISGTMTQSMQLGLPIVVYKTTGTPVFNKEKECALIAELGNVEDLAAKMFVLMDHPEKAEMLAKNAREFQEKRAEYNRGNGDRLVSNFRAIIENFHNGTLIPQEQLFDPERDD